MKARFQPETEANAATSPSAILIDPEAYDASEQQFAASLEQPGRRFVVDVETGSQESPREPVGTLAAPVSCPESETLSQSPGNELCDHAQREQPDSPTVPPTIRVGDPLQGKNVSTGPGSSPGTGSWRHEVTERLSHYRARRQPRQPRYPSLQLKFESSEPAWHGAASSSAKTQQAVRQEPMLVPAIFESAAPRIVEDNNAADEANASSSATAKIIEFPRATTPAPPLEELAEPVFTMPRILEAADAAPAPPALGGILIEPAAEPRAEKRPGFEIPLQSAPMAQRIFAAAVDAVLVAVALAGFGALFFKITACIPPLPQVLSMGTIVAAVFWAIYQCLLLVCAGSTPGLKLARLQLSRFDGSAVPHSLRRWRVLASLLSAASLGLGYVWCFFDEDQLSWHDRITRTHMAPR